MDQPITEAPLQANSDETYKEAIVVPASVTSAVTQWCDKVRAAREHWGPDFKRMQENMEFSAGMQWAGQDKLDDDRYIANMVLRMVNQKVAALYAKNPRFVAQRRKRLDFQIWDGKMESLTQAVALSAVPDALPEDTIAAGALIADFTTGRQQRDLVDKVGRTLEYLLMWFMQNSTPNFKTQMKQLVRRVVTCGVGYLRLDFAREDENVMTTTEAEVTIPDRLRKAQEIMNRIDEGTVTEDSPEIVELKTLLSSLGAYEGEKDGMEERLVFDFPMSTSVIVDPRCRALKGFVGADWIAQEYIMTLSEVNAFFGTKVGYGDGAKEYQVDGNESHTPNTNMAESERTNKCKVCVWEVFQISSRSRFFVLDGYNQFLKPPEPVLPETKNFWPLFALTFNETEVEPGKQKATIFPPSDVQVVKSAQKEWNRSRQALREQRAANNPKYMTGKGWLTEDDKKALVNAIPNSVIEIAGAPPNADITKLITAFVHAPIDPMMYDTSPLQQDIFGTNGNEDAAVPASAKGTATAATINEQSRVVVTGSNVDDLDDFFCDVAEAAGEILMRELSMETVQRIVGPGAVWPETNREDFVNYVFLEVLAASSGRPNKALEIANFQQLAPIMLQAGASPQFIVREAIKRLDDRLDIDDAFALGASAQMAMPLTPPPGQQPQSQGEEPSGNPPKGQTGPSGNNTVPPGTVQKPPQKTE